MARDAAKWLIFEQTNKQASSTSRKTPDTLQIPAVTLTDSFGRGYWTLFLMRNRCGHFFQERQASTQLTTPAPPLTSVLPLWYHLLYM